MKTLIPTILVLFAGHNSYAGLDERITIAKAKELLSSSYKLDVSELNETSSCEQIDTYLKKHGIQMTGINEQIISAKEGIVCESEKSCN